MDLKKMIKIEEFKQAATEDVLGVKVIDQTLFAELIVRECARICEERGIAPSTFTADDLLEHFGLK